MVKVSTKEFRDSTADCLNKVIYGGERVVVERRGVGVAAVVSMDDLAALEEIENRADLKAALKARKEKGSVPLGKVKARLGMG